MTGALLACVAIMTAATDLPVWNFDSDLQGWTPNSFLTAVSVQQGNLCATAAGSDPFFTCSGLEIAANPWQYVAITIKATAPGRGELFWSGETTGQYGGFSQEKTTSFEVASGDRFQEIVLFPFWQGEKVIRQLRLDLYDGAQFEISGIKIVQWGNPDAPVTDARTWTFDGDLASWRVNNSSTKFFAPPLRFPASEVAWATVTVQSQKETVGSLLWSTDSGRGIKSAPLNMRASPDQQVCNVKLEGLPEWKDNIIAFGIELPHGSARVQSIALSKQPQGPADIVTSYLGFGDAMSRARRPARIIAQVANRGGAPSEAAVARIVLPQDTRMLGEREQQVKPLACGESATLEWQVVSENPGPQSVMLKVGSGRPIEASLEFAEAAPILNQDYVPTPQPIKTSVEICAYYFPGWEKASKWDCIRNTAPIRKPVLGYYDEGNSECVDWQIKWAVENGISCFLVDWYWSAGNQSLTQWFEAYRKAKYRDMLKVAIMWANHNAPGTHSPEDWRAVTKQWIDNYFNLPAYYKINGKPAVFIWAPSNLRADLKGPDNVRAVMDESQEMARKAGYQGIEFVAVNLNYTQEEIALLAKEGYTGVTNYHEWGTPTPAGPTASYQAVVQNAPAAWETKNAVAAPLTYYPVIDTGWDSRPWHGEDALNLRGRNADLFANLLQKAKEFATAKGKNILILGPLNEWGEGSYIEPCLEHGFEMYQAIRLTFTAGPLDKWPVNLTPADIGRGPYDYKTP